MTEQKTKEYADYKAKNSDPYGSQCVEAGEAVMKLLDEGKTPEEAIEGLHGLGLTGFMAGAAIAGVCYFHDRGEELKKFWNERHGNAEAKGVINPAIIEIK